MNIKPTLKVQHKLEELITYIETNDFERLKKIVASSPSILKKTRMDDKEPIFYAIKYKCNKIFNFILENSSDIKYNTGLLFEYIIEFGSQKAFRSFLKYFKVNVNTCHRSYITLIFKSKVSIKFFNLENLKLIEILLNETDFYYTFSISLNAYNLLNYNFNYSNNTVLKPNILIKTENEMDIDSEGIEASKSNQINVVINKRVNEEPFKIDFDVTDKESKFNFLFQRYKKMLLIKVKGVKPPKNLRTKDYQEIVKYL